MSKFHVNDKGEAGECAATKGNCPFGGEAQHYESRELAQKAYELSMASKSLWVGKRKPVVLSELEEDVRRAKLKDQFASKDRDLTDKDLETLTGLVEGEAAKLDMEQGVMSQIPVLRENLEVEQWNAGYNRSYTPSHSELFAYLSPSVGGQALNMKGELQDNGWEIQDGFKKRDFNEVYVDALKRAGFDARTVSPSREKFAEAFEAVAREDGWKLPQDARAQLEEASKWFVSNYQVNPERYRNEMRNL